MKTSTLASQLRHRIVIEQPTETADGTGGFTTSWTTLTSVWADIQPLTRSSGREQFAEGQLQERTRWRITIRYREDVTEKMRISYNSRVFNIRAIIDLDGREEQLILIVEEGAAV